MLNVAECNTCHSAASTAGGWHYQTYESMLSLGDCSAPVVSVGDASSSLLYQLLAGDDRACEINQAEVHRLPQAEIDRIEAWINFGAPERCVPLYTDVRMILDDAGCGGCHGAESGWMYDTYDRLLSSGSSMLCGGQPIVESGNAAISTLYHVVSDLGSDCLEDVHQGVASLPEEEIISIRDWINSGLPSSAQSLPVILSDFRAQSKDGAVQLSWMSEVEIGTDRYVIERRGVDSAFEEIASMAAAGNSQGVSSYTYEDENPIFGDNYYRLKIIDLDGTYSYSLIRRAIIKFPSGYLSLFPNPLQNGERLRVQWYPQLDQSISILKVVDMQGRVIFRKIIFEGNNYVRLPSLPAGMYFTVIDDLLGGLVMDRFIVVN